MGPDGHRWLVVGVADLSALQPGWRRWSGSFVAHIGALGNPPYTMALSTYGDAELAKAVRQFAKIYRKSGRKQVHGLSDLSFTDFDVIVTETQRPVYLVLESPHDMRLWNILLAPGARIERVVLIGGR